MYLLVGRILQEIYGLTRILQRLHYLARMLHEVFFGQSFRDFCKKCTFPQLGIRTTHLCFPDYHNTRHLSTGLKFVVSYINFSAYQIKNSALDSCTLFSDCSVQVQRVFWLLLSSDFSRLDPLTGKVLYATSIVCQNF